MAPTADFGPGFLRRVRIATAILGTLGALVLAVYIGYREAAAALSGVALSLVNLTLLENLFHWLLVPPRSGQRAGAGQTAAEAQDPSVVRSPDRNRMLHVLLALGLKLPLLIGGALLILGPLRLPPLWFVAGFSLVLAVILLKAAGGLLSSRTAPQERWRWVDGRLTPPQRSALRDEGGPASPASANSRSADPASRGPDSGGSAAAKPSKRSPGSSSRHGGFGASASTLLFLILGAGTCLLLSPLAGHAENGEATGAPVAHAVEAPGIAAVEPEGVPAAQGAGDVESPADPSPTGETHGENATEEEAHAGEVHEGGAHSPAHEDHPPELPNAVSILHELFPTKSWANTLYRWQNPIFSTLAILFLCIVAIVVYRRRTLIPGRLQNVVELLVESFSNFILGILGPRGKEFIPFLGTLFFYIWLNNLMGLIPFLKSPTSVFNTTVSLAICVFVYVQYTGLTKLGPLKYVHHMMGSPQDVMGWAMVPLMLPLHLIEEVAKPVSLSLRLFGNILGEDILLGVFAGLGIAMLAFTRLPIGIPLHLPFIFLSILMSTIQALVFTLLATIYFFQMMPHEHEEEHESH